MKLQSKAITQIYLITKLNISLAALNIINSLKAHVKIIFFWSDLQVTQNYDKIDVIHTRYLMQKNLFYEAYNAPT